MNANAGAYVCRVMICDTINALILWLNASIYCYGNPKNIINSFTFFYTVSLKNVILIVKEYLRELSNLVQYVFYR